jgi:hypothetical protein
VRVLELECGLASRGLVRTHDAEGADARASGKGQLLCVVDA